jgi:hypothetical protein
MSGGDNKVASSLCGGNVPSTVLKCPVKLTVVHMCLGQLLVRLMDCSKSHINLIYNFVLY